MSLDISILWTALAFLCSVGIFVLYASCFRKSNTYGRYRYPYFFWQANVCAMHMFKSPPAIKKVIFL